MYKKILNKEETYSFIDLTCLECAISDQMIQDLIDDATSWQTEIGIISYFASMVLENKRKKGFDCLRLINKLYNLQDVIALNINEIDADFIHFLLRHVRPEEKNLEDSLTELNQHFSDYDYARSLRL